MTSTNADYRSFDIKPHLLGAAPAYIDSLQEWRRHPALVSGDVLNRIVHRYANLWLPLVSEWSGVDLEPPLDVHWAWHLHLLNPQRYADYCLGRFRRIVPHRIRIAGEGRKPALARTRLIWRDRYPDEAYDLDLDGTNPGTYHPQGADLGCILDAAKPAMNFAHQVSLPHYRDANFLFQALIRYKKFLLLRKRHPDCRSTVPVDIVLMWKVHAMFPANYYDEAMRSCQLATICSDVDQDGRCLGQGRYDDRQWSALYRDPLLVPGSAYRGAPDYASLRMLPPSQCGEPVFEQCDITIDEISVGDLWSRDKAVVVVVRLLGSTSVISKELLRLETPINKVNRSGAADRGLVSFKFNTRENQGVEFDVHAVRSRCCGCGRGEVHLNTMTFNPREPFEQAHFTTRDFLYQIPRASGFDPKVSFRCRLLAAAPEPHVFSLIRAPFSPTAELPEQLTSFVGTLPKWRRALEAAKTNDTANSEFMIATHELKSRDGSHDFAIETIKQYDLDLSAVLVYHNNDQLVALAHSVGDETIASPSQLTGACPLSLDPESDELALSISNHHGEWAICKGHWTYHSGGSGVKIDVIYLSSHKRYDFDIRDDELQTIRFGDVTIDMPSGRMTIDSRSETVAENVALAFSVGILYVSCQMRATILATSRQSSVANLIAGANQNGSVRSVRSTGDLCLTDLEVSVNPSRSTSRFTARRRNRKINRRRKLSASYTFLLASGLLIDLTLHGSTRNSQPPARTSLASLHMLYDQSKDGITAAGLSDARNNNYPPPAGANQNPSPGAYGDHYTGNSVAMNGNGVNGNANFARRNTERGDGTDYMDVRL